MVKEETVPVGFRMPRSIRDKFDQIATDRQVDLTVLLNEACLEYIKIRENPENIKEQMRQILLADPMLLHEPFQKYAAHQLIRK